MYFFLTSVIIWLSGLRVGVSVTMDALTELQEIRVRQLVREAVETDLPLVKQTIQKAMEAAMQTALKEADQAVPPEVDQEIVRQLTEIAKPIYARLQRIEAILFRRGD